MTDVTWGQIKNKRKELNEALKDSPTRQKRVWQEFKNICQEYSDKNGFVTRELEKILRIIEKKNLK